MLWTAWRISHNNQEEWPDMPEDITPYKVTHKNHPMCLWVRSSTSNYLYTVELGLSLCQEKKLRYPNNPPHKCEAHLVWLSQHCPTNLCIQKSKTAVYSQVNYPFGTTPVPLCMPEKYHSSRLDLVSSYIEYFRMEKMGFATWKTGCPTMWTKTTSTISRKRKRDSFLNTKDLKKRRKTNQH